MAHYVSLLGVRETGRDDGHVELSGENFLIYVVSHDHPVVVQEFVSPTRAGARARFEAMGCRIFDESTEGFHVTDPFGMSFHVFFADGETSPPTD
ncbi:MAG: hypothetical protein HONBIEJF_00962 [Fimbriimonadaceae bacterium]|nr:hypothetical protein [Fimbriimonadaceae bacterium]